MKTILFQGDSVTDCSRERGDPGSLGSGYVLYASRLLPGFHVLNRGCSGDRARDLAARWQADCLDLSPDIVSIHIGINDTWRRYDSGDPTGDAAFEADYRRLIEPLLLLEPLRNVQVLLIVPFVTDSSPAVTRMREDLSGKQAVVRSLAREYSTALLDADALLLAAVRERGYAPADLAADGVHPTALGHRLLGAAAAEKIKTL